MQKEAWTNTLAAVVLSACCLMLRWLQSMMVYDAETGLPEQGAGMSRLLILMFLASAVILGLMSRRLRRLAAPTEPEEALAAPPVLLTALLAVAGLGSALGCVMMYFTGSGVLLKFTALLGLLAVPALLLFPLLPRWGGLGAVLSLGPVIFFSVWMVVAYRENAVNPVVWDYGPLILAIAAVLYAVYQLAGYLFYRARPARAAFACGLAPVLCLCILMDEAVGPARIILAFWAVGLLAVHWLLIRNMEMPPAAEEEYA